MVKYPCRRLRKVYGPDPLFSAAGTHREDARDFTPKIRNQGCIRAVCDTGFDLHIGEIFVVIGLSEPFAAIDEGGAVIGKISAHSLVRAPFCEIRGGG